MNERDSPHIGIEHFGQGLIRLILFEVVCISGSLLGTAAMVGRQSQWIFYQMALEVVVPVAFLVGAVLGALVTTRMKKSTQGFLMLIACVLGFICAFFLGWVAPLGFRP